MQIHFKDLHKLYYYMNMSVIYIDCQFTDINTTLVYYLYVIFS